MLKISGRQKICKSLMILLKEGGRLIIPSILALIFAGYSDAALAQKKIAFAHMVNTIEAVDWAVALGVNGVELDLRFDKNTNQPTLFQHSALAWILEPCDCIAGGSFSSDNVCSKLNPATCNASTPADVMLTHLAGFPTKLAVVYIDSKVTASDPTDLATAGRNVVRLIDAKLFASGYKGDVVIAAPDTGEIRYLAGAREESSVSSNKDHYFFAIDGMNSFPDVIKALIALPTKNRVYSVGISALAAQTYYDQIALSASNEKKGVVSGTGIWTLDNAGSMKTYLDFGADSIMTNVPATALTVLKDNNMPLAQPGEAFKASTSDAWVSTLDVNASCESNSNCANGACGRPSAEDGAKKVCCSSGRIVHYAGYDYCGGMSRDAVCWSDSMCAAGLVCRGNRLGTARGHCRE